MNAPTHSGAASGRAHPTSSKSWATTDALPTPPVPTPALQVVHRGAVLTQINVPPARTLLAWLRDDLGLSGTKEGCASGDCGACTVVLGEDNGEGGLRYRAVNSCIKLAHSAHGQALWTVQDLAPSNPPQLHPVQQALVDHHASQCGFCTPGFVMSLWALYQTRADEALAQQRPPTLPTRDEVLHALSGNLCRCTGYRPLVDAGLSMLKGPVQILDANPTLQLLQQTNEYSRAIEADFYLKNETTPTYWAPTTLPRLLQARARSPQAQLVAGCTDVGLWITKGQQQPTQVLDVMRVAQLRAINTTPQGLEIGAAASLTDAFAALVASRPALSGWANRFAGLPVRNAGTLGGNVANGSPIGDSMPVLLALGASVRLMAWAGEGQPLAQRELPLHDFYLGYRQTTLALTEVLTHVLVPHPEQAWCPPPLSASVPAHPTTDTSRAALPHGQWLRAYKISKRFEDDISAVCLGLQLELDHGTVTSARIGVGGVAATPVRARQTEAALTGQPWSPATVTRAMAVLSAEFAPISDMRASAAYRRQVLGALLQRAWLESQGHHHINLEHADLASVVGVAA